MSALPPFQAAILDMDGLVLDSESTYCAAWRLAAAELGYALAEDFCHGLFGQHASAVEAAMWREFGPGFERERFYQAAERHWFAHLHTQGMARMPGVEALLDRFRAQGVPFALATNSDGPYARRCLERSGLGDAFAVVVTRDQVPLGKPAPDVYLEAARRLGVDPVACLALEDSPTGLAAADAAGMITILVQRHDNIRTQTLGLARYACASLLEVVEMMGGRE